MDGDLEQREIDSQFTERNAQIDAILMDSISKIQCKREKAIRELKESQSLQMKKLVDEWREYRRKCDTADDSFRRRLKTMVDRHKIELKMVISRFEWEMDAVNDEYQLLKMRVSNEKVIEESQTPIKLINRVSESDLPQEQKEKLIHSVSPRKNNYNITEVNSFTPILRRQRPPARL